jgi:hypothetical protein
MHRHYHSTKETLLNNARARIAWRLRSRLITPRRVGRSRHAHDTMSGFADIRVDDRDVDVPRFRPVRVKVAGGTPREQVRRGESADARKGAVGFGRNRPTSNRT